MTTYIIGDVHGCYDGLARLLDRIAYQDGIDQLIFLGDLVNRGPDTVKTIELVLSLKQVQMVYGNHDLYAWHYLIQPNFFMHQKHRLSSLIEDQSLCQRWLDFLKKQQFILHLQEKQVLLVHAGIWPEWTLAEALSHARRLGSQLNESEGKVLEDWFTDKAVLPLTDPMTDQFAFQVMTRMRFVNSDDALNLSFVGTPELAKSTIKPWWQSRSRWHNGTLKVFFGHWSALKARSVTHHIHCLDGGYVWGGDLVAYALESEQRFSVTNPEAT
jgi:bis(5'-nucleosyl)-tetraphosphatase (symmetrical)